MPELILPRLLGRLWPYALGGLSLLGAYLWTDHRGYVRGAATVQARDASAAARIEQARVRLAAAVDRAAGALATARVHQDTDTREITREAQPILVRPLYRAVCIDADGVGLLDRARAAAERGLAGQPAERAGAAPGISAER